MTAACLSRRGRESLRRLEADGIVVATCSVGPVDEAWPMREDGVMGSFLIAVSMTWFRVLV